MKIRDIGEIGLIKHLAGRVRRDKDVIEGIGDDTAVIRWTKDKYLLFTCDMTIESVHFKLPKATPFQIGWKALGRNISDIAAMGGRPRYALVSIAVNPKMSVTFLDGLYKGMDAIAKKFGVTIVGGDTSKSDKLMIDISMIGEVERKNLTLRSGARSGDLVLITGSLGGSMKGRHLKFTPRLNEARKLVEKMKISSMIDVSDGLAIDMSRILDRSNVGARLYEALIPVSKEADSFESAMKDGEDFELLFTMSEKEAQKFFRTMLSRMTIPVTLIGEITNKAKGFKLITRRGKEIKLKPEGYLHF